MVLTDSVCWRWICGGGVSERGREAGDDEASGAQKKEEKEVKVMCKAYSHNLYRRMIP